MMLSTIEFDEQIQNLFLWENGNCKNLSSKEVAESVLRNLINKYPRLVIGDQHFSTNSRDFPL